jgi:hypothetical protein
MNNKVTFSAEVQQLIGNVRDYTSDASIQLDSALDKIAFLDLNYSNCDVQELIHQCKVQLRDLKSIKRRLDFILAYVQA